MWGGMLLLGILLLAFSSVATSIWPVALAFYLLEESEDKRQRFAQKCAWFLLPGCVGIVLVVVGIVGIMAESP